MPNTTVCPLAKKCGGCQLQNLSYPEQLHLKQATAIRLLGRFGHVEEIIGMKDPYHYRNKVQAAFGVNRQGQIISGVYQSASHRIVPVSDCMIEDTVADRIIVTIRKLLKSFKIRPYDEDTGRGTLRHVLVRRGRKAKLPGARRSSERPVFFCFRQKMNDFRALHGQAAGNVIHSVLTRKSACKW